MRYVDEIDLKNSRNFTKTIVKELVKHLPKGYVATEDIVVTYTIRQNLTSFVAEFDKFEKEFTLHIPQLWEFRGVNVEQAPWSLLDCMLGQQWIVKMRIRQRVLFTN